MIKNVDLEKYEIEKWDLATENPETITWVWMQLMGEETEKGDTLDFSIIKNGDIHLFAGVLRNRNGAVKGLIPERYSVFRNGVLDEIDHTGRVRHDNMDALDGEYKTGYVDLDVEALSRRYFESDQPFVIRDF